MVMCNVVNQQVEALQKREQEQKLGTMVVATKTGHPMEQQHGHLQWEKELKVQS